MSSLSIKDLIQKIGKRIYHLRKESNMTQLDLAVKSEIDERQIQRLENGHTSPTIKTLLKIANAFGISLSELFRFD
ncbi:MAG: helix-turn-helix domain-containing protein [Flavobacteriaceae bacterium]|nr:MAG: helix-turn-helix domain-containing protein [Flavobacteriaceae bacterium]